MINTLRADIVTGLGFGDEGKGRVIDRLILDYQKLYPENKDVIVVRFNGGPQAGHTVWYDKAKPWTHIYSNFGSGALRDVPTYWSEFCAFDPLSWHHECLNLNKETNKFYLNAQCPIITFEDKLENWNDTIAFQNGTCGTGYGKAMKRHHETPYKIIAWDLFQNDIHIMNKFELIAKYYSRVLDKEYIDKLFKLISFLREHITLVHSVRPLLDTYSYFLFEGAQGFYLDEEYGYFPHVTWGRTTTINATKIIRQIERISNDQVITNYHPVTRCYSTRHGNGPFREGTLPWANVEDSTNIPNMAQGSMRSGPLEIQMIAGALNVNLSEFEKEDILLSHTELNITCIDQIVKDRIGIITNLLHEELSLAEFDNRIENMLATVCDRNLPYDSINIRKYWSKFN